MANKTSDEKIRMVWRQGYTNIVTIGDEESKKQKIKPGDYVVIKFKKIQKPKLK